LTFDTAGIDAGVPAAHGHRRLAEGLSVTWLGFGAMQLPGPGVWGPPRDRDAAIAVLRRVVDLGLTHVDTSDAYGPQVANELIRQALHPYPPELVVATKVGVVRDRSGAFAAETKPDALRDQVERNLRTLGVDRLDLVYLRVAGDGLLAPDEVPLVDSFAALAELRDRGSIRHLGLSGVTGRQLAEARRIAPVVAVQNRYHLLDRGSDEVLAACEQHGIAFVAYFPLGAGMLDPGLDRSRLPPGMSLSERQASTVREVASRHGATWAQIALAWLLERSPAMLAIPGTRTLAHLEENAAAGQVDLSETDLTKLDRLVSAA
jgi:pyridoxine 4-dehydrogenase